MGDKIRHVVNHSEKLLDHFWAGEVVREFLQCCGYMGLQGICVIMEMGAHKVDISFSYFHLCLGEHDSVLCDQRGKLMEKMVMIFRGC